MFDDEIYQEYKRGSSVKEIMKEYGISLKKFLKEVHKEGKYWFCPFLFNQKKLSYTAVEEIEDFIKKKLDKNVNISKIYYKNGKKKICMEFEINEKNNC